MRLVNPYTGLVVDAPEEQARLLMGRGFKPEEEKKPEEKPAPKRRASTRAKKTE